MRQSLGVADRKYDHGWGVFEVGLPRISSWMEITTENANNYWDYIL